MGHSDICLNAPGHLFFRKQLKCNSGTVTRGSQTKQQPDPRGSSIMRKVAAWNRTLTLTLWAKTPNGCFGVWLVKLATLKNIKEKLYFSYTFWMTLNSRTLDCSRSDKVIETVNFYWTSVKKVKLAAGHCKPQLQMGYYMTLQRLSSFICYHFEVAISKYSTCLEFVWLWVTPAHDSTAM